ncbi:MAG TPA: heavy metal-binding domain-containing protein [Bryobacteraceae bacterium]|nr:heavy metal-binding domain-containing protein [Bryobacteraceae bacterium]
MDRDVRSPNPARCPKCGMTLVAGIPEGNEYPLKLQIMPRNPRPGHPIDLTFTVEHPVTGKRVTTFDLIHEKLMHLFVIGQDLDFFLHEHPEPKPDGRFTFRTTLPNGGEYRLLCDFYPSGGTPQMTAKTIVLPGKGLPPKLESDLRPRRAANLTVSLRTEPAHPRAGTKTMLFCDLEPFTGLQPYLGAWGHLLAASSDLVDLVHSHPAWEDPGPTIQFNLIFPRPGLHRIWLQFQREGTINTVAFNVPVSAI